MAAIEYTPEGAVLISYQSLVSAPETLGPAIGKSLFQNFHDSRLIPYL